MLSTLEKTLAIIFVGLVSACSAVFIYYLTMRVPIPEYSSASWTCWEPVQRCQVVGEEVLEDTCYAYRGSPVRCGE